MNRARFLLLVAAPVSLIAWTVGDDDQRLAGRLDAKTREAVVAVVDAARREGLPTEPIIDKALEGASKQASGVQIVTVVRSLVGDLKRSREALGPGSSAKDVEAGAHALRAGVSVQALERLRVARAASPVASALDVMTILTNDGVPADSIAPRVVNLVLAGASADQLYQLRQEIKRYMAGGLLHQRRRRWADRALSRSSLLSRRIVAMAVLPGAHYLRFGASHAWRTPWPPTPQARCRGMPMSPVRARERVRLVRGGSRNPSARNDPYAVFPYRPGAVGP